MRATTLASMLVGVAFWPLAAALAPRVSEWSARLGLPALAAPLVALVALRLVLAPVRGGVSWALSRNLEATDAPR